MTMTMTSWRVKMFDTRAVLDSCDVLWCIWSLSPGAHWLNAVCRKPKVKQAQRAKSWGPEAGGPLDFQSSKKNTAQILSKFYHFFAFSHDKFFLAHFLMPSDKKLSYCLIVSILDGLMCLFFPIYNVERFVSHSERAWQISTQLSKSVKTSRFSDPKLLLPKLCNTYEKENS